MSTLRYAPTKVYQITPKGVFNLPVIEYIVHPPGNHPANCPIGKDYYALELITSCRSSWQGFERAPYINSELRMIIDIYGREKDEVLNKLPKPLHEK
jgi:hypothetical protein